MLDLKNIHLDTLLLGIFMFGRHQFEIKLYVFLDIKNIYLDTLSIIISALHEDILEYLCLVAILDAILDFFVEN